MKKYKVIYYVTTALLSFLMLGGAFVELSKDQASLDLFAHLGYPVYLLTILGIAKILGVIGIWQNKVPFLREWAYAGFTIDLLGAFFSHLVVGDAPNVFMFPVVVLFIALASYWSMRKLRTQSPV